MVITLTVHSPFSLSKVIRSHGWVRLAPFETDEQYSLLSYIDRLDTGRVTRMQITQNKSGVRVETDADLDPPEQAEVIGKVTWMLGLDQEFTAFYTLARTETKLAHVEANAQGRLLRSPTLFEDTVKTILTTNTAWSGTIRMVSALVNVFGESLPGDDEHKAFPTPAQLATAGVETLRNDVRLGYRAPYVWELAMAVASDSLDLEAFKDSDLPTPELRSRLLGIKGIGAYAAANLLMLLGRYDFIPIDSWALKLVSHEWYAGEPVGEAEVEAAFEQWGEWKGLAYWMWDWDYQG